jgi:hypothetical protein
LKRLVQANHQLRDGEVGPEKLRLSSGLEKEVKSSDHKPFSPWWTATKPGDIISGKMASVFFFHTRFGRLLGMDIDEKGIMPGVDCKGT